MLLFYLPRQRPTYRDANILTESCHRDVDMNRVAMTAACGVRRGGKGSHMSVERRVSSLAVLLRPP